VSVPRQFNFFRVATIPSQARRPGETGTPFHFCRRACPCLHGIRGGVDIRDAHNGALSVRVYLPEPLAMLSTDIDGLHGGFLTVDEHGQRLFAVTTSGLSVANLANVPLGIGTLSQTSGPAAGGTVITSAEAASNPLPKPPWVESPQP
jgi:hypothetical protein